MTGLVNPDRERVTEVGGLLLLQKPFTREAVIDALTIALARSERGDVSGHTVAMG